MRIFDEKEGRKKRRKKGRMRRASSHLKIRTTTLLGCWFDDTLLESISLWHRLHLNTISAESNLFWQVCRFHRIHGYNYFTFLHHSTPTLLW